MARNGRVKITDANWSKFEGRVDSVTKLPFKKGDTAAKCAACGSLFHADLIENGKCPFCAKPMQYAAIELGSTHLKIRKKPRTKQRGGGTAAGTTSAARTTAARTTAAGTARTGVRTSRRLFRIALAELIAVVILFFIADSKLFPEVTDPGSNPMLHMIGRAVSTAFGILKSIFMSIIEAIGSCIG